MGGIYHDGDYYAGSDTNDRASKSIITDDTAYNPSKNYVSGDWFIDGDVLYEVKIACQGVTPPNATYYEVKTVHDLQSEIGVLKEVLSGKYIIVDPHKTIYSSSSSGVATTLMKQVADNLLTYTQALSNDEIFILKGLSLPSISYFGVLSTGLYKLTNADTTASYWFSQMTCSSSSTYIYNACVSSTSSTNIVTRADLSSSGTVINNMSSNSLTGTVVIYGILLRNIA